MWQKGEVDVIKKYKNKKQNCHGGNEKLKNEATVTLMTPTHVIYIQCYIRMLVTNKMYNVSYRKVMFLCGNIN